MQTKIYEGESIYIVSVPNKAKCQGCKIFVLYEQQFVHGMLNFVLQKIIV